MKSILIRYTDSRYAKSYVTGDLYLSSLSRFWDLRSANNGAVRQQDISEGVAMQLPHDVLDKILAGAFEGYVIHDARFRIEAYGYCNLLCFYRIDAIDTTDTITIDPRYTNLVRFNPVLNNRMNHVVQIPDSDMNSFGDTVIIIKDENKFTERVLAAIRKVGGECVVGDVRYHPIKDRLDPSTLNKPHMTIMPDALFDMKLLSDGRDNIISYGSLDKYDVYAKQKEWRICWLPDIRNHEPQYLHVGDMSDTIEIMPTSELISKLQSIFPGYFLGYVKETRNRCIGTLSYKEFKGKVESIDGKCRPMFEIGQQFPLLATHYKLLLYNWKLEFLIALACS